MKLQVTIEVWNAANPKAEIDSNTVDFLQEVTLERVTSMIQGGYTSGDLSEHIRLDENDPEDGIHYRGAWKLEEINQEDELPEGFEVIPEDLVSHLNDWRIACQIALNNIESPDVMDYQDSLNYWQNKIYLLNNIEWEISRLKESGKAISTPKGWALAPVSLKAGMRDWEEACEIAARHSAGADSVTHTDDRGYWEKQLRTLEKIDELLKMQKAEGPSPWYQADEALPSIPEHHMHSDRPLIVKTTDGKVMPAHLYAGCPNPEEGTWRTDEEGMKERHWVALEGGSDATSRIIPNVKEWMFLPSGDEDRMNFVVHIARQ